MLTISFTAFFLYMLFSSILGGIAGLFLGIGIAAVHPLVLQEWEKYKKEKESRERVQMLLDSLIKKLIK